jgi:hypothetical protein
MGGYTDFVLKGSVDNFQTLCYWFASSSTPSMRADPVFDAQAKYYVAGGGDGKRWDLLSNTTSAWSQTGRQLSALVMLPSKIAGSESWMFKGNRNLKWAVARADSADFERDITGNVMWFPIFPVSWESSQIIQQQ